MIDARLAQAILAQVNEEELVAMASDVVNIASPTGSELEMGNYMRAAMQAMGLRVTWQEVEPGRANVVGLRPGRGSGPSLMFNGHMDTSNTGREEFLTGIGYKPKAVIKNRMIYGLGIYNMKGALACYCQAAKALERAGVMLAGDVLIAAVVGEIEKTQWSDEFTGSEFRGYGAGTHYLVNHGVAPDACILGEPTDLTLVLGHYGSLWARISTHGPYVHTAFSRDKQKDHSIRRAHEILSSIYEWAPRWEEMTKYGAEKGLVNVGCVRGGYPWRASRTPDRTDIFLDLRVPPTMPMQKARRAAQEFFAGLEKRHPDFGLAFETYVSVPGAEIREDHPLVKTLDACHQKVLGAPPKRGTVLWSSDASVMTRYGIETINYGPSSGPRDAEGEKVAIDTLLNVSKIYAIAAAEFCGVLA